MYVLRRRGAGSAAVEKGLCGNLQVDLLKASRGLREKLTCDFRG